MDEYPSVCVQIWLLLLSHTKHPGFWPDEVTKATQHHSGKSTAGCTNTRRHTQWSAVSTATALYCFLWLENDIIAPSCCLLHSRTTEQQKDQQSVQLHAASVLMHRRGSLININTLTTTASLTLVISMEVFVFSRGKQKSPICLTLTPKACYLGNHSVLGHCCSTAPSLSFPDRSKN